jgi:hypothetical protein
VAPSDPLVDGLRVDPKDMDQGFVGDRMNRSTMRFSGGPEVLTTVMDAGVVETRRLELLTLSLQRRRSTD